MTSKKEERRDTWSESDKSVKETSYTPGEEEEDVSAGVVRFWERV